VAINAPVPLSLSKKRTLRHFRAIQPEGFRPVLHLLSVPISAPNRGTRSTHSTTLAEFRRMEALNYAMLHDDGQQIDELEDADVV
jgi:regulator of PEP synthase PpsR (kinase-PPPase family)